MYMKIIESLIELHSITTDTKSPAAFPGAPEEIDVTVFPSSGPAVDSAAQGAENLVAEAHGARQFTNMGTFTLRCGVCQMGFVGQKGAQAHATTTGHQNFAEYL